MEQTRLILAVTLSFLVFLIWNLLFYEPPPPPENPPAETAETRPPADADPTVSDVPIQTDAPPAPAPPAPADTGVPARTIRVETDQYIAELSEQGAAIVRFTLKNYREHVEADAPLKQLISQNIASGTALTGFSGGGLSEAAGAMFTAHIDSDELHVYDKETEIRFSWRSPQNVIFEKRYRFAPGTYLIGMEAAVQNVSANPVSGNLSVAIANETSEKNARYSFEGPSGLINNDVEQVKIKKIRDKNRYPGEIQWVSIESRYFLSAVIPDEIVEATMNLTADEKGIIQNQYIAPESTVEPGKQKQFLFHLYFGPKSLNTLKTLNNGLDRIVNFGMFDFLAKPCLWLMNLIHDFIPNYGVAIIILTVFIKLLLWPLGNKSYKSMNEMKRIQPLMADIREKYKNDKRKMNEELMNLYRVYKVNPMGGCLPMVLQIPVFFAFYRMLYEAIELRHAPFFLWINDLSAPDRLFEFGFSIPFMEPPYGIPVLTVIMGATMVLQQKMSPPPGDPAQAKMMMFMPIIFTVIFINFSSGLVLYWLINNILSIAQQYYISKTQA